MQKKPLLVMFIGVPGSGKTYFATKLAEKLGAVRLNSDGMRLAIFGSLEAIDRVYHSGDRQNVNTYVFGAMDYTTKQVLSGGVAVVYEAIQRTYDDRRNMRALAEQAGATPVLIWMKVDKEVAITRTMNRTAAGEVRRFTEERARQAVEHFSSNLDVPTDDEHPLVIPGDIPFEEQYKLFEQFVKAARD